MADGKWHRTGRMELKGTVLYRAPTMLKAAQRDPFFLLTRSYAKSSLSFATLQPTALLPSLLWTRLHSSEKQLWA